MIARAVLVVGLVLATSCAHAVPPRRATTSREPSREPRKVSEPTQPRQPVAATVAPAVAGTERGLAVWYARGKMTASGERFDKRKLTAAHKTLPFGTRVRVTAERNGKSVVVRINDRGPYGNPRRIIDLTEAAAAKIDLIDLGVTAVTVEILERP